MHIYAQFGALIKARLSFRHQKQVQYEMVQDALEHQKDKLASLEGAEQEARRLEEALERGGKGLGNSVSNLTDEERIEQREQERERERERLSQQSSSSRGGGAKGGFGLFNAVKHSLSGMMDVDPEATRRANIGKTRDNISQVGSLRKSHAVKVLTDTARRFTASIGTGSEVCIYHFTSRPRPIPETEGCGSATHDYSAGSDTPRMVQAGESAGSPGSLRS